MTAPTKGLTTEVAARVTVRRLGPQLQLFVVPHVATEGELSDADLEKVAGGKGDIEVNCHQYGAAMCAAGTMAPP